MKNTVDVAIVGAGPYGLSLAATLRSLGIEHRIFGVPMQTWAEHMPQGMHLKSPAFGSSLYDPSGHLSFEGYCNARGLPYDDIRWPIPLSTYVDYGRVFQEQLVPNLEQVEVTGIEQDGSDFALTLASGERLLAHSVVMATGIRDQSFVPPQLRGLSPELVSHTRHHAQVDKFRGRSVAVIGGGASALDFAALAAEAGAHVQVFARKKAVKIFDPPAAHRPLLKRLRHPWTGLGTGWKSLACVSLPLLFRHLPETLRLDFLRKHLGPSGTWIIKKTIQERVRVFTGLNLTEAREEGAKLRLRFSSELGPHEVLVDHVVAGTGYKIDLDRLTFMDSGLRSGIKRLSDGSPALDAHFESSVPGLYFVGLAAAASFGPMLRFVYGSEFACKRVALNLAVARVSSQLPMVDVATLPIPVMSPAMARQRVAGRH